MIEEFEIPVKYNNQQYHFKAKLLQLGSYTHKIQVDINGTEVLFEPDEDRSYRAGINPTNQQALLKADTFLLKEIALSIESILR